MQEPDFTYYAGEFGGALGEAEARPHLRQARLRVEYLAGMDLADVPEEHEQAVAEAICLAADAYAENGYAPSAGFSIGSFRSEETAEGADGRAIADGLIRMRLSRTGLLYRGL